MKKFTKNTIKTIARENGIDISVFDINKHGGKYYVDIRYPYETSEPGAYDRMLTAYTATVQKLIDAITAAAFVKFTKTGSPYRGAVAYVSEAINDVELESRAKAAKTEPDADTTKAAPAQTETRLDIAAFYAKYVEEYGFLKDNGDNVAGFAETLKAFDAFTENENNAAFVREFCERMGDYITSDREAAAFMFTLESMTAPPMCETETEASETVSEAGQPAPEADEPALTNTPDGLKFHGHEVTGWDCHWYEDDDGNVVIYEWFSYYTNLHGWVGASGAHKFATFAEAKEWAAKERDCELVDDREDDAA